MEPFCPEPFHQYLERNILKHREGKPAQEGTGKQQFSLIQTFEFSKVDFFFPIHNEKKNFRIKKVEKFPDEIGM